MYCTYALLYDRGTIDGTRTFESIERLGTKGRGPANYPTADDWSFRLVSPHLVTPGLIVVELN